AQQLAAGVRPVMKDKDEPAAEAGADHAAAAGADHAAAETATEAAAETGTEAADAAAAPTGDQAAATAAAPAAGDKAAAPAGQGRKGRNRNRKRRREPRPPERRCEACIEFLKDRKTHEIPCSVCATPIYWPPESQLQTHLGNWAEPSLCGACKRDATEAARAAQREALRHPPMPGASEPAPMTAPSPESCEPEPQPQAPEA